MCGIIGIFAKQWSSAIQSSLNCGLDQLRDRGPDDRGLEIFSSVSGDLGMGHTRLSIIDLSEGGHQPMVDDSNGFTIVFNGEIYNYLELRDELKIEGFEFATNSDTEVLLKAWIHWGEACIGRLVGMFAFAVFDSKSDTLTLVRDAFGIKPLFYSNSDGRLSFASEIRAILPLLDHKPIMDRQTAYSYLIHGSYDNLTSTFFENVSQLQPGYVAKISLSDPSDILLKQWWSPSIKQNSKLSFDDAAAELRELFLNSVKLHLRSDVPLCVNLSGGIDSSAIACAIAHLHPGIPINTVSFVARGAADNEEVWIDIVNKHIDASPHKVLLSGTDLTRDLDDLLIAQGEPFVSASVYASYMVFQHVKSLGFVVSLDGQGADEMLGGYDGYPHGVINSMAQNYNFLGIINFIIAWSKWPERTKSGAIKALIHNTKNIFVWKLAYLLAGRHLEPKWLNSKCTYAKDKFENIDNQSFQREREFSGRTLVGVLRSALTKKGLRGLLRHGDRNSMRWSVENRVPFLTTELAEFCLGLPEEYLVSRQGETKRIFRAAMRGIVPDEILDRRDKIGFKTPELSWVMSEKNNILKWIEYSREIELLESDEFIREIKAVLSGVKAYSPLTWRMISFCRWAMVHNLK